MLVGGDYDVSARVVNNQMEDKTCRFLFSARIVSYDGKLGAICGHAYESNLQVMSGEGVYGCGLIGARVVLAERAGVKKECPYL